MAAFFDFVVRGIGGFSATVFINKSASGSITRPTEGLKLLTRNSTSETPLQSRHYRQDQTFFLDISR